MIVRRGFEHDVNKFIHWLVLIDIDADTFKSKSTLMFLNINRCWDIPAFSWENDEIDSDNDTFISKLQVMFLKINKVLIFCPYISKSMLSKDIIIIYKSFVLILVGHVRNGIDIIRTFFTFLVENSLIRNHRLPPRVHSFFIKEPVNLIWS